MRSAWGGGVILMGQGIKLVLGMVSLITLARLLSPVEFGLVAMVNAVIGFAGGFRDLGLPSATIQRQEINHRQISTLFWMNAVLSLLITLFFFAAAPLLAWFYHDPRVMGITLALSLVFLIDGVARQHEALLSRQMRFPGLIAIEVLSTTVGLTSAILLARAHFSYWALVGQEIVIASVSTMAIWTWSGWWPGKPAWDKEVRPMVNFGLNLAGFKLLNYLTMNLDWILIGRFCQAGQLGFYEKSYNLLAIPYRQLTAPLTRVIIPALSRLQKNPERYRSFYIAGLAFSFALSLPLIAFLFVDAETAVLALLGSRWLPLVSILRVMAPALFFGRFNIITNWPFISLGHVDRQLRWAAYLIVPTLLGYFLGIRWGTVGVAATMSITTCGLRIPAIIYCFHDTHLKLRDVWLAAWRPFFSSISAGFFLWSLHSLFLFPPRG